MSHRGSTPAPSRHRSRLLWTVVGCLLAVGIIVPLLVFAYDAATPTLFGFPFYYWFQFALIPVVSALTYAAFKLSEVATRQDREDRR